jgi:hypothetical protein
MEAANRGAHDAGALNVGLNIALPHEQSGNPYITPSLSFKFHYFALRKMHFMMRAKALVAFPGGFGTLDELFEVLTLVQTGKAKPVPIVLFGTAFWKRLINFDAWSKKARSRPKTWASSSIPMTRKKPGIQDMGLLELDLPPIQLHASTQTDIRTPEKARFLQDAACRRSCWRASWTWSRSPPSAPRRPERCSHRILHPRRAVRGLQRPVLHQPRPHRPQRQPGRLQPGLPPALRGARRAGPHRRARQARAER